MTLSKFLDPKNNFAFLQIFGTEKNKDILLHFLNDVLKYKENQQITEVSFLKTIQDPEIAAYRQSDRKSTRLNSSHRNTSRMPSSA